MAEHSHRTFNTKWSITDDGIRYEGKFIPFSEIRRVVIHESDDSVGYFTSFDVNDYVLFYNSSRRYDKIDAKADAEMIRGKRVLIVDDVISTGESLHALEALVEKAGGIICGRMAILAEGDAQERKDLIYLEKLPLFHPDGTVLG